MRFDPDELRSGANQLYDAAWLTQESADQLTHSTIGSEIFGSFAAAESFHNVMSAAHSDHVNRLLDRQKQLGTLGDKTHRTASVFVDMEERNTRALREVLCPNTRN